MGTKTGMPGKLTVLKERPQLPTVVKPVAANPVRGAHMDNVTMEVGRRLRLRLSGSAELAYAMVDDVVDGQLHIGVSLAHRRPASGEIVDIEWGTPRGWYSLPCAFEGIAIGKLDTWLMRPAGPVNILQRRGYVRVEIALSVTVVDDTPPEFAEGEEIPDILPDPPEIGALTLDMGEGGARISVPASFGLIVLQRVRLRLLTDELDLDAGGHVVRVQQGQSRDEVAICFDQPVRGANELRRAVMRWQARERMMRAG